MYTVHLAKEPFKFSCSHFTILAADKAERLHGHNYQVRADIALSQVDPQLGFAFDFNAVKPKIRELCDSLDERILIASKSPFLKIASTSEKVEVTFGKKHYVFPADDTVLLPLTNITSEELAKYLCEKLVMDLKPLPHWTSVALHVEETRGQSVSYLLSR